MGKGDKRTKRGKIIIGTYGVTRPKKKARQPEAVEKKKTKKKTESSAKKTKKTAK